MSEPDPFNLSQLQILKSAMTHVRSLKWAFGVVGVAAAAAAIFKNFFTDARLAVAAIIVMLILMTLLVIFSRLAALGPKEFRLPAKIFMWFSLILVMATSLLLFSATFFRFPKSLPELINQPSHETSERRVTNLRGVVRDIFTKQGIDGAVVEIELLPGKTFTTATDGGFSISEIPAAIGDSARVYVRKHGYKFRDEYVTLPGPETVYLEPTK